MTTLKRWNWVTYYFHNRWIEPIALKFHTQIDLEGRRFFFDIVDDCLPNWVWQTAKSARKRKGDLLRAKPTSYMLDMPATRQGMEISFPPADRWWVVNCPRVNYPRVNVPASLFAIEAKTQNSLLLALVICVFLFRCWREPLSDSGNHYCFSVLIESNQILRSLMRQKSNTQLKTTE